MRDFQEDIDVCDSFIEMIESGDAKCDLVLTDDSFTIEITRGKRELPPHIKPVEKAQMISLVVKLVRCIRAVYKRNLKGHAR